MTNFCIVQIVYFRIMPTIRVNYGFRVMGLSFPRNQRSLQAPQEYFFLIGDSVVSSH